MLPPPPTSSFHWLISVSLGLVGKAIILHPKMEKIYIGLCCPSLDLLAKQANWVMLLVSLCQNSFKNHNIWY